MKTKILTGISLILLVVTIIGCDNKFPSILLQPTSTLHPTPTTAPEALNYLNKALDLIEENSYYRKNVDWMEMRMTATQLAAGSRTPVETYWVINSVFQQLGDRHGRIIAPDNTVRMITLSPNFASPVGKMLEGRLGYILVPGFNADPNLADEYASQTHLEIEKVDQLHPCGWIVDLRGNPGGGSSPMEVAIGPILGEGKFGGIVDADGNITSGTYLNGYARLGNEYEFYIESPYTLLEPYPPVAVLTDSGTDSAAEVIVIDFRGRPNTRSFGQPTGGHNPGEGKILELDDGAVLWITTRLVVDRTGHIYPQAPIQPDEVVMLPSDGSVPQRALEWLLSQPSCTLTHDTTPISQPNVFSTSTTEVKPFPSTPTPEPTK